MKIPVHPPDLSELLTKHGGRLVKILEQARGAAPEGKYRHWDTLRHITPPGDLSSPEWWLALKFARLASYIPLPLRDKTGKTFQFAPVDVMQQMLMQVDRNASGQIRASDQVTNPETRETYVLNGIMEEAITSSQLEGASTTRDVAKEMIKRGREPQTIDERMIYNNYQALLFIRRMEKTPLTPGIVTELHKIVTAGTLLDNGTGGPFRPSDEPICVMDEIDNVLHMPPASSELEDRMRDLCDFANGANDGGVFVHPAVRAITLHFWLAYDHPFVDGNGRTARALFYWSMASQGYWLCEYISISRILKKAPSRYSRSFLYTETDDNDLTYFLLSQLSVVLRAISDLNRYLEQKAHELRQTQLLVQRSPVLREQLNFRQLAIIRHAMKHPRFSYTIDSHKNSHNISYATARSDLLKLGELHLLEERTGPKRLKLFIAPADLQMRLARMAELEALR